MTIPVTLEGWANPPWLTPVTVQPPGGTAAPAAGTPETWVMAGGFAWFPPADPAARPPSEFRVFDLDAPGEIIMVTDTVTTPGTWRVIRGDQGSAPAAHAPRFEVRNVVTAAGLATLAQGVPSTNGLVLPDGGLRTPAAFNNNALNRVFTQPVAAGEAAAGSVYEMVVWGHYWTGPGAEQRFRVDIRWFPGNVILAAGSWGTVADLGWTTPVATPGAPARWRAHGLVSLLNGNPAVAGSGSLLVHLARTNAQAGQEADLLHGEIGTILAPITSVPISTAAGGYLEVQVGMFDNTGAGAAPPAGVNPGPLAVQGGRSWRAG